MRLPNPEGAVVEYAKLAEYCLNPIHFLGQHKARVFASRLGLEQRDAAFIRAALLSAAKQAENVVFGASDGFGTRYILDFELSGPKGSAIVRSAWIVRKGEDFPRLTSCYVL
jgi:hypothetical protein